MKYENLKFIEKNTIIRLLNTIIYAYSNTNLY